jgi:hypothetical protein
MVPRMLGEYKKLSPRCHEIVFVDKNWTYVKLTVTKCLQSNNEFGVNESQAHKECF